MTTPKPTLVPRYYQREGIAYLTTPRAFKDPSDLLPTQCAALLTDAPGSGKTPQSAWASDLVTPPNESIGVIAPAFLCDQWFRAWQVLFPDDDIIQATGPKKLSDLAYTGHVRVYIISVQSLRKDAFYLAVQQCFKAHHVTTVIVDESHYIKNKDAIQSKNVARLCHPHSVNNRFLLTATPILKEAQDLYMQLHVLDPYKFHSYHAFLDRYCWYTNTAWGPTDVRLKSGALNELSAHKLPASLGVPARGALNSGSSLEYDAQLNVHDVQPNVNSARNSRTLQDPPCVTRTSGKQCIQPSVTDVPSIDTHPFLYDHHTGYMLGRSYAEIGLELPRLLSPEPVTHLMSKIRRKTYDEIKTMWSTVLLNGEAVLTANSAMEVMNLLRRLTSSPEKAESLIPYIDIDMGPFLIATHYKRSAAFLVQEITRAYPHMNPILITGDIDAQTRVTQASNSKHPNDVVVATIASLSEGCDLSHCNTVYFFEEDYTPGRMHQFLSRVRRHRALTQPTSNPTDDYAQLINEIDPNERPVMCRYFHADRSIDQRIHAVQSRRAVNVKDIIKTELNV